MYDVGVNRAPQKQRKESVSGGAREGRGERRRGRA